MKVDIPNYLYFYVFLGFRVCDNDKDCPDGDDEGDVRDLYLKLQVISTLGKM